MPSVKRLLASYRWRRRLAWAGGTAFAAVAVVATALIWPNTAPNEKRGPSNTPAKIEKEPKAVRLKTPEKTQALKVVSRFIYTAVARKNIDRSWDLVAPELKAGFTREQWDTGEIPVVGFPVESAKWRLEYSDVEGVGFSLALYPTEESRQRAQVFLIGLHPLGTGKRRHWVVDNWQAAPTRGLQTVGSAPGGGGGTVLESVSPKVDRFGKSTESAAWLLLPLGLLSLIIFVPLTVASVNWYRGYRAERALLRS